MGRQRQIHMRQILPDTRLYAAHKRKLFNRKFAWPVIRRPAFARDFRQLRRFFAGQILRQRDMGMIGKRPVVFQLPGVEIFMERMQFALARARIVR